MTSQLMALALIPGILIIIYIYRKDKVEKEPRRLIVKLIILGAVSCAPAALAEMYVDSHFILYSSSLAWAMSNAFICAALCEEVFKFIFLYLGSWRNRNFDYRFDGIVYGVSVAVGFALLENLLYVADGGFETAIVRAFLSVPLHAFCGVFMGIFYGAMMKHHIDGNRGGKFRCFLGAIFVPILIHGTYDTFAFLNDGISTMLLLAFVIVMYVVAIRYVNKFSREDWNAGFYRLSRENPDAMNTSVILQCPLCGCYLRLPKGAGKIIVTCTRCGNKFESHT